MAFKAVPQEDLIKAVEWCFESNNCTLILTLIDGTSICGIISGHYSILGLGGLFKEARAQDCCYTNKEIILQDRRQFHEKDYFIPFEKIAGITAFSYSQEEVNEDALNLYLKKLEPDKLLRDDRNIGDLVFLSQYNKITIQEKIVNNGRYHIAMGFHDALLDDLYIKCRKLGFLISEYHCNYYRIVSRPFAWGELKSETEYPMYVDWEYINNISGGINSIGVGILAVSGSVSWQKSLYSYRSKLMEKKSQNISNISKRDTGAVVIKAYVDHIYMKTGKKKTVPYEFFAGDKWFPVILSEKPIQDDYDLQSTKWCVGYLKEKCMTVPKIAFEATQSPLKIQGEIVPMSLRTPFGNSELVIKIRNISST